tara:strand:+ start:453 stop:674 length:222 start_codon:yes stop_codon:yes gene_type:complete
MTSNNKGQKFFEAHKRWISKAISFKGKVGDDFKWDFVDSLSGQIEKEIPLTGRQFKSLKKIVFLLGCRAGEKN